MADNDNEPISLNDPTSPPVDLSGLDEATRAELRALDDEVKNVLANAYPPEEDYLFIQNIYYLWLLWADFKIYITSPYLPHVSPPVRIEPEVNNKTGQAEWVYPILDAGDMLSTSRGEDIIHGIGATGKFLNTIEKLVNLAVDRCREAIRQGGDSGSTVEMRFSLHGYEVGRRKAFNVCVDSGENIVITNFDPGEWGERQLRCIQYLAERGYLAIPPTMEPGV